MKALWRRDRRALYLTVGLWLAAAGVLVGQLSASGVVPPSAQAPTATPLPTIALSATVPPIPTGQFTPPPTATSKLATDTPSPTPPPTATPTPSATATPTGTPPTPTPSPTGTLRTPTATGVASSTASATRGPTPTSTRTPRPGQTSTTTPTPSITPTLGPTPCPDNWQLAVWAFPDSVGKGPIDFPCPGCDGFFRDNDRYQAAACPIAPLRIIITSPTDGTQLVDRFIDRFDISRDGSQAGQDIRVVLSLCHPPPYRVIMFTEEPPCYRLCPNSPSTVLVTQHDYDRGSGGGRKNAGRYAQVKFFYASCHREPTPPPPPPGGCAIHPSPDRPHAGGVVSNGRNGDFEQYNPVTRSIPFWTDLQNARRVLGNLGVTANGTLGQLMVDVQGPVGAVGHGEAANEITFPANPPASATLKADVYWRVVRGDPAAASFKLTADFSDTAGLVLAGSSAADGAAFVAPGAWQTRSVLVAPANRVGKHKLRLKVDATVGVEVYIDNVELDFCPQAATPTPETPTATPRPSDTPTPPPSPTATPSATPRPSDTPEPSATPTATRPPTVTPIPSNTPVPSNTPIPSNTPVPTNTPVPSRTPVPSNTPIPSRTPIPSDTPPPTATRIPSSTPIPSNTPVPSATPRPSNTPPSTVTPVPSDTPVPTATRVPSSTPVPSATPRPSNTPVPSATPRPSNTPVPSATPRPSNTPVPSSTPRPTNTLVPSSTPRPSATTRPSATPRPTQTPKPTATPTNTPEPTRTRKPTETPPPTRTPRPTNTPRLTATPKPTSTPRPTRTPGGPEPTDEPRTPAPPAGPGCPDGPSACLRLLKYYDLNGDGQRSRVVSAADRQAAAKLYPDAGRLGDGEPPLEGIAFEIVEWRPIPEMPRIHRRSTDASGEISICFDYPAKVTIREVGHVGGGWSLTTQLPDPIQLQCSTTLTLPIGNARLGLPKTGHAAAATVGGRFGMAAGVAARWVGRD